MCVGVFGCVLVVCCVGVSLGVAQNLLYSEAHAEAQGRVQAQALAVVRAQVQAAALRLWAVRGLVFLSFLTRCDGRAEGGNAVTIDAPSTVLGGSRDRSISKGNVGKDKSCRHS